MSELSVGEGLTPALECECPDASWLWRRGVLIIVTGSVAPGWQHQHHRACVREADSASTAESESAFSPHPQVVHMHVKV